MRSMPDDYSRIEKAIHYLDERFPAQPGLNEVAKSVNLSPFHFQRLFRRWAGISPKRFLQFLMLDYAKHALDESGNVLDAAYAASHLDVTVGDYAMIEVSDSGAGIPRALLGRIFEPFFTTDPQGTGLGLYIARELAEYNRAKLVYAPPPGGGTQFRILFAK